MTDGDIQGADMAFQVPVEKVSEIVCRCRECKRNDIPATDMAIWSWKAGIGMWTGICKQCFLSR